MEWLLIITLAVTSSAGGGHATIETIPFQSEQSCEEAKEKYLEANKNIEGLNATAICISQATWYKKRQ